MKVYNVQSDMKLNEQLKHCLEEIRRRKNFNVKNYIKEKCELLNTYMRRCKLKACVIAVSGGVDSSVVLALVNHASKMPKSPIKRIVPLLLPIVNSCGVTNQEEATKRGEELCEYLKLNPYIIDLSEINTKIQECLEPVLNIQGKSWAIGQLGPYSRTPILYYTTSLLNQEGLPAIICGTTNRDEGAYLGYVGKASDGMVDVQLISDLHKSEVYKVAEFFNLPKSIINVVPSGDMYDYRTDEMVFGASYDFVELYLNYLNFSDKKKDKFLEKLNDETKKQFLFYANNLENLHSYNRHKYMSKSPAVHLDLWNSSCKGGWDNYFKVIREWLKNE